MRKRFLSIILATAMMLPIVAPAVEAAIGTWLAPAPGQKITSKRVEISVGYNTQSSVKVTRLELWIDGKYYDAKNLVNPETRGVISFWWDVSRYAEGTHNLAVRIFAGSELISTVKSTGTVGNYRIDARPPVVSFSNIKAGDVIKGTHKIRMEAQDDSGDAPLVSLLVDNSLKLVKNTPPYNYDLDTTTYNDGDHQLQTYAIDTAGNKSNPVTVKIAFKNGKNKPPVVASVAIDPKEAPVKWEDEDSNASEPKVIPIEKKPAINNEAARVAVPKQSVVTGNAPITRNIAEAAETAHSVAACPVDDPAVSEPEQISVAMAPQTRGDTLNGVTDGTAAAPVENAGEPESAACSDKPASCGVGDVRSSGISRNEAAGAASKPIDEAKTAEPRPVRVAMLPDIQQIDPNGIPKPIIAVPPVVKKDNKAKLEKKTLPVGGKIKARDLFEGLGGILFWDDDTHTVTAYVKDMKVEFTMGCHYALVNGRKMPLQNPAYIVNGRAVIDASLYRNASRFVEKYDLVASL